jgi:retinol dehydrogenase-12
MENLMNHQSKIKAVVVTGATAGIGYQTALDFAANGDFVIGIGRDTQRCTDSRRKIIELVPEAKIQYLTANLASQKQIRALAVQIGQLLDKNHFTGLDVLVNNAGLFVGKKEFTEDGIETTFAVNHLAPFLLTNLLLPRLTQSPDSRVITVSSDSHYNTRFVPEKAKNPFFFFGLWAYQVSKLSNVLFSLELNHLQKGKSPHAFAVDPGLVNTEIGLKDTGGLAKMVWRSRKKLGVSPKVPSETILFLASDADAAHSSAIYWHECKPKQPSQAALDLKMARRLWIESCKLCNLPVPSEGDFS